MVSVWSDSKLNTITKINESFKDQLYIAAFHQYNSWYLNYSVPGYQSLLIYFITSINTTEFVLVVSFKLFAFSVWFNILITTKSIWFYWGLLSLAFRPIIYYHFPYIILFSDVHQRLFLSLSALETHKHIHY